MFVMFRRVITAWSSFQFCLLIIVLIEQNIIFVLPRAGITDLNGKDSDRNIRAVSDATWAKVTLDPGKDKLNLHRTRQTRDNMTKSVLFITGGILILIIK